VYLPLELAAGQTIAERYRLVALRGAGGMGSVWQAELLPDRRECALKVLHRFSSEKRAQLSERFMREARVASSIDSPNAVRVFDYGVYAEVPFIAMELLEGETLGARLAREGRLSPVETSRIISQVACALERAHALGIVHRDLKPENIFLTRTPQGSVAKVLDFGIAKMQDDHPGTRDLTETGALLGTPHYMSPEQVDGARYVDQRADLWSLGVIAFECTVGQRPFQGKGLRALFGAICLQIAPIPSQLCSLPRGFDRWFAKATQKDPDKRFRSAVAMASELRQLCEDELALTPTQDEAGVLLGRADRSGFALWWARQRRTRGASFTVLSWMLGAVLVAALAGWIASRSRTQSSPVVGLPPVSAAPSRAPAPLHAAGGETQQTVIVPTSVAASPQTPLAREDRAVRAKLLRSGTPLVPPTRNLHDAHNAAARVRQGADASKRWDVELLLRDRK
jgi:Protein kinase domain